jgi:superkiller protein 3
MLRQSVPLVLSALLVTVSLLIISKQQTAISEQQTEIVDDHSIEQLFERGNTAQAEGDYAEAERIFRQVIREQPNNANAHKNLGVALSDQGKLEEAIAAYRRALELDPDYAYAHKNLGVALSDQGKLEEAIAAFRRALQFDPDNATAHNNLGFALEQQGKLEQAIKSYRRALELDPDFPTAQNNLEEAQRLLAKRRDSQRLIPDDRQFVPSEEEEPLVNVLRSTARIIAKVPQGNMVGTGWVVKREGNTVWIVTNRHVISNRDMGSLSQEIEVEFFSELESHRRPRYNATILRASDQSNRELDLAVLQVTGVPEDIEPLEVAPGRVSRRTSVLIVGHPFTVTIPWNVAEGSVMNYNPQSPWLPIDAYVAQGNSGGPVINENNEVIALMARIRTENDIATNSDQQTPVLSGTPATGGVGVAYRVDFVLEKLQEWEILD